MAKLEAALVRWKIDAHARLEAVWENRWCGIALTIIGTVVCALLVWRVPAPGVSVASMGVAAALLAARTKANGAEKAIWMLIISSFLVIEVLAIRKDRESNDARMTKLLAEEQAARSEAKTSFTNIGNGIETSISQASTQFAETMRKSDVIVGGVGDSVKSITGGDSFCYVILLNAAINSKALVGVVNKGKYPMYNVRVQLSTPLQAKVMTGHLLNQQTVDALGPVYEIRELPAKNAPTADTRPIKIDDPNDIEFNIQIQATNGDWLELLRMKRVNGSLEEALKVMRLVRRTNGAGDVVDTSFGRAIYRQVSKNYPRIKGKVDWGWDAHPNKLRLQEIRP